MSLRIVGIGILGAGALVATTLAATPVRNAVFGGSTFVRSQDEDDEHEIEMSAVPDAVKATATRILGSIEGCKASMEKEDGATLYEVSSAAAKTDVKLTADGHVVEVERVLAAEALPAGALANLKSKFPGASITEIEEVEQHYFSVAMLKDGKKARAVLSATGRVWSGEDEEGEEGEEEDD